MKQIDYNLLSVSQICDKQFSVHFDDKSCYILKPGFKIPKEWIILKAPRVNNLYILDMLKAMTNQGQVTCFLSKATEKEKGVFPWRYKMRPPGFINWQILPQLVKRMKLADIMTILGSIYIIMGEVDC